jgi:YD repeat-containing protein
VTTVTQSGQSRSFIYDSLKQLTKAVTPESGTTSYTYDANGNVATKTDARNFTTTYTYDVLNRLTGKTYSDNSATQAMGFSWDFYRIGSLAEASDGYTVTLYSQYDALGRVGSFRKLSLRSRITAASFRKIRWKHVHGKK